MKKKRVPVVVVLAETHGDDYEGIPEIRHEIQAPMRRVIKNEVTVWSKGENILAYLKKCRGGE